MQRFNFYFRIDQVIYKTAPDNWNLLGGIDDPDSDSVIKEDDGKTFFYQLFYHSTYGRFEDIPEDYMHVADSPDIDFCTCCTNSEIKNAKIGLTLGEELKVGLLFMAH